MAIDRSLARGLASRSRDEAISQCMAHADRVLDAFLEAMRKEADGSRRAKVVRSLVAELRRLLSMPGVVGKVGNRPESTRKHLYLAAHPDFSEDAVFYSVTVGILDERKPIDGPECIRVLMMTRHVFERLHQRIDTVDSRRVLAEIGTAALHALKFRQTAGMLGLKQWPLLSTNGMFVAVPGAGSGLTTLVTWLPREGLGAKWSPLCRNIDLVPDPHEFDFRPCAKLAACLEQYAWLKRDYEPPKDDAKEFWAAPREG